MQLDIGTAIVAALTAFATWTLKPIVERLIEAFFRRKPVFAISPHVLRESWSIKIEPVSGPARRKKALNVSFRGTLTMNVGVLDNKADRLRWTMDVSAIEVLRDELMNNTFADFQLFFDSNHMSEPMRLTRKQGSAAESSEQISSVSVETTKSFLQAVSSQRTIFVRSAELLVNDGSRIRRPASDGTACSTGKSSLCVMFRISKFVATLLHSWQSPVTLGFSHLRIAETSR